MQGRDCTTTPPLEIPRSGAEHSPQFLDLAALYAGESLEGPEFREFTKHLQSCDICQAWVDYWRPGTAVLDGVRRLIARRLRRRHHRHLVISVICAFLGGAVVGMGIILGYLALSGYDLRHFL